MKTTAKERTVKRRNLSAPLVGSALLVASSAFGALKYQPSSYVAQDALVVWLDGIHNVGLDQPHDSSASMWTNLADASKSARIVASNSSGWRKGCGYYFNYDGSYSYAKLVSEVPAMTKATFEFVFEGSAAAQTATSWGPYFITDGKDTHCGICMGDPSDNILRFLCESWTGNDGSMRPLISNWSWKQASYTFGAAGDAGINAYDRGILKDTKKRTTATEGAIPAATWVVGCRLDEPSHVWYLRQLTGLVKCVRIYNRELTAAEVAENAVIDAARFDGVVPVTNAVIATSVVGANGTELPGVYAVDGSHTFTAPSSVTVGNTTYECAGYTLESWDGGAWGTASTMSGTSCTVTESEKVRIIWRWTPVRGLRTAADYGIADYVQAGLVVWLDGVHNVSADQPHDSSASMWANLADASKPARLVASNSSGWRDGCGYYFNYDGSVSYAKLAYETAPMTFATFEFVFEGSEAAQTARDWGPYFINDGKSSNNCICMGDPSDNILRFKSDGWTGNNNSQRPMIPNWRWQQASFTLGAAGDVGLHAYEFGVLKDTRIRTTATACAIPAATWVVGSRLDEPSHVWYARQLTGLMKCVRIYDRELTAAEVAHNAKVDAARFDGALLVTNVVVAGEFDTYEGVAPGVYEVEGSYTFTASNVRDANGKLHLAGYTIEPWEGSAWGAAISYSDTSYTYTVGTDPAKVRLTWKWQRKGMVITFH